MQAEDTRTEAQVDLPKIDRGFAEKLLKTFDNPQEYGVHLLFNDWWAAAPQSAIDKYVDLLRSNPVHVAMYDEEYFCDQPALEDLNAMPEGSIGKAYYKFIIDNGLEKNLAMNYKQLHDFMAKNGALDRMPADIRYSIIRGFQLHDLMHVLTGYEATPFGELALQAYTLAQNNFPYMGMWMATTTARMTLLTPEAIDGTMTAISHGWTYGKNTKNIQFEKWEDRFSESLADAREEFGIAGDGSMAKPPKGIAA